MNTLSPCAAQVKRYDYDRFLCTLFAEPMHREPLFALLAFNQEIAKISHSVSEPMVGFIKLQWWREALEDLYNGTVRGHDILKALPYQTISYASLEDMISAREADMDDVQPATQEELIQYIERTSCTLFSLCAQVTTSTSPELQKACHHLGIAWALTGIMRAVKFPDTKRILFPQDRINGEEIRTGHRLEQVPPLAKEWVALARQHLKEARALRKALPASITPIFLPARLAELYLSRIEKANYDLFHTDLEGNLTLAQLKLLYAATLKRF